MRTGPGLRALLSAAVLAAPLPLASCSAALREPRPVDEIPGLPPGLTTADAVLDVVRARVRTAERAPEAAVRRAAAESAVETVQWCGRIDPGRADCSYWLGVALGLQARERPGTAADALPRMVEAFSRAATEAPSVDHAGPDRALALLYLRAPGWPLGPGDADEGLEHARRAVELEGAHAPNLLALAEALAATGDEAGTRDAYGKALEAARAVADRGETDAREWMDEAERGLGRK